MLAHRSPLGFGYLVAGTGFLIFLAFGTPRSTMVQSQHYSSQLAKLSAAEATALGASSGAEPEIKPGSPGNSIYCEAEAAARDLVREKPFDSLSLVRYAAIAQLSAGANCSSALPGELENPKPLSVIDFALERAPYQRKILLGAAIVARRMEELGFNGAQRNDFLKRALETPGEFTEQHRRVLGAELDSAKIIRAAVPLDMRSALLVSQVKNVLLSNPDQPTPEIRGAIADLQRAALDAVKLEVGTATENRIVLRALAVNAADARILAKIDALRAQSALIEGNQQAADFFTLRQRLELTRVLHGVLVEDLRPERSALVRWRASEFVSFDVTKTSIVAAVPAGTSVGAVQLKSGNNAAQLDADEVEIWASDDNLNWRKVPVRRSIEVGGDGEVKLLLELDAPVIARLFKAHFTLPIKREKFRDTLDRIMEVYRVP